MALASVTVACYGVKYVDKVYKSWDGRSSSILCPETPPNCAVGQGSWCKNVTYDPDGATSYKCDNSVKEAAETGSYCHDNPQTITETDEIGQPTCTLNTDKTHCVSGCIDWTTADPKSISINNPWLDSWPDENSECNWDY